MPNTYCFSSYVLSWFISTKMQIKEQGMYPVLVNCFWVLTYLSKFQEHSQEDWNRKGEVLAKFSQTSTSLWCTRQCPVPRLAQRRTCRSWEKAKASRLKITRLSGAPTAPAANGRQRNQWATRGPIQRSVGHTGLSGVHRIVSDAPIGPKVQQSAAPDKEGDRAPDSYCPCPVVHH
jgi:hypothetical protein